MGARVHVADGLHDHRRGYTTADRPVWETGDRFFYSSFFSLSLCHRSAVPAELSRSVSPPRPCTRNNNNNNIIIVAATLSRERYDNVDIFVDTVYGINRNTVILLYYSDGVRRTVIIQQNRFRYFCHGFPSREIVTYQYSQLNGIKARISMPERVCLGVDRTMRAKCIRSFRLHTLYLNP